MKIHSVACLVLDHRWEKVREWGPDLPPYYSIGLTPTGHWQSYCFSRRERFLMVCRRCGSREVWRSEKYFEFIGNGKHLFFFRAACL